MSQHTPVSDNQQNPETWEEQLSGLRSHVSVGRFLVQTPLGTWPDLGTKPNYEPLSRQKTNKNRRNKSGLESRPLKVAQSRPRGSQVVYKKVNAN